jgi:hypothetical protein
MCDPFEFSFFAVNMLRNSLTTQLKTDLRRLEVHQENQELKPQEREAQ